MVEVPGKARFTGVGIEGDGGAQVGADPPLFADLGGFRGHGGDIGVIPGAGGPHEGVQVGAGLAEFQLPGGGGGVLVRAGVHQDPADLVHRVGFARPGKVHDIFGDPVGATPAGRFVDVALGDVVHRCGAGRDPGCCERGEEPDSGVVHRGEIA
ncbi:MAG: hypothetical protein SYR96_40155, partial [Actinomycetota bacterium]|nr:hypothetical protein [Actinomycetota bacterium]